MHAAQLSASACGARFVTAAADILNEASDVKHMQKGIATDDSRSLA